MTCYKDPALLKILVYVVFFYVMFLDLVSLHNSTKFCIIHLKHQGESPKVNTTESFTESVNSQE